MRKAGKQGDRKSRFTARLGRIVAWPMAVAIGTGVWISKRFTNSHEIIGPGRLMERLRTLKVAHTVVDVRSVRAFEVGSLPRAINVPLDDIDAPARVRALPHLQLTYVFDVNGSRIDEVQRLFRAAGLRHVRYVRGGFEGLRHARP